MLGANRFRYDGAQTARANRLQKPDEERLWHRRFISGRVDLDRGALKLGFFAERRPSFRKAIGIESPRPAPRAFLIQEGSAYLLTWILPPAPRPPLPVTPA